MAPRLSVILATYNQPELLDLVLHSYARQSCLDFELIVADDGSGRRTADVVERHKRELPVRLERVWQPDQGFRKAEVLNRAALRSRSPYLLFSDGDCLAERTLVREHLEAARPNGFVVGGFVELDQAATQVLTARDVAAGRFEAIGRAGLSRPPRLGVQLGLRLAHAANVVHIAWGTRAGPRLCGRNFSVDRDCFFGVNGFDNTYRNARREDLDLRNRLRLAGARARSRWHRARVYHMHQPQPASGLGWGELDDYYSRSDLLAEAPRGLREVAGEGLPALRSAPLRLLRPV